MEFNNLKKAIMEEYKKRLSERVESITSEESLKNVVFYEIGRTSNYKGTYEEQKQKAIKNLEKKFNKLMRQELNIINSIEDYDKPFKEFYITIEWIKSYMWGYNPRARDSIGFNGSSIGGCGYDKISTATAQILNQHPEILKLMYTKKDQNINKSNHKVLGYGSGCGIVPRFEGGVGIDCHINILKGIGLDMVSVSWTDTTDVYRVFKEE